MKTKQLLSLALLCAGLSIGMSGCTTTANRAAYVATGATTETITASIKAFNQWRLLHPLTKEQSQQYANALATYIDACEAVRAAETAANGAVTASADVYDAAEQAGGALLTLLNQIAPLIVKSPSTQN